MPNYVAEAWLDFATKVLPANIGRIQFQETRRAFYAGAFSVLDKVAEAVSGEDEWTERDANVVEALALEQENYIKDLQAGRA